MPQAKEAARRKRRAKAVPVLGAAGLSFSLVTGASAAAAQVNPDSARSTPVAQYFMDEEEISDVSLATFHVRDSEGVGPPRSGTRPTKVSQGACGADLYYPQSPPPQSPPAVGRPVYRTPLPPRYRPVPPAYKHRRP
jgi:hypothetical protein